MVKLYLYDISSFIFLSYIFILSSLTSNSLIACPAINKESECALILRAFVV